MKFKEPGKNKNILGVVLFFLAGCQAGPDLPPEKMALFQKGKELYIKHCTICHGASPKQPGSSGPPVYGSTEELLALKIFERKYPPGHTPKMKSKFMPEMSDKITKEDIASLFTYLNN